MIPPSPQRHASSRLIHNNYQHFICKYTVYVDKLHMNIQTTLIMGCYQDGKRLSSRRRKTVYENPTCLSFNVSVKGCDVSGDVLTCSAHPVWCSSEVLTCVVGTHCAAASVCSRVLSSLLQFFCCVSSSDPLNLYKVSSALWCNTYAVSTAQDSKCPPLWHTHILGFQVLRT